MKKRYIISFVVAIIILSVLFLWNVGAGSVDISTSDLFAILAGSGKDETFSQIVWKIRLPRILAAILLGGALSVSGFLLQSFFQNPIAGPYVLGISSGAKLVVALTMIFLLEKGIMISSFGMVMAAFVGSMLAMGFVLLISFRVSKMSLLVVCGIMIGYICSAITDFCVTFASDSNIVNLHNWSMGSFSGMTWENIKMIVVIVGAAVLVTFCLAKPIGAYQMGEAYARNIGVDIDNLYISQPDCGEQALEITETMVRSGAVDIVVVDSVAALVPKAEIDGDMGDSHVGLQARLMSQALRKLTAVISKSNCIVIFINQLREKVGVMFGNPETTTGGRALKFYSSVRLDVRRTESLKQGGEIVGNHVRVKVVKNKIAPPFREAEFDIMFGQGISREGDVLDLAVNAGIVNKSGAWYAYEGDKIGQGRENAKTYIHENPAFFDMLEAKVRDFYFTQPEDEDATVQEDSKKPEAEE